MSRRVDRIAERADKKAMKALLKKSREATRQRLREELRRKVETPDYLQIAHEHAAPAMQPWRDLTQLLAINRMLSAIGSTEAVREIIRIHVRFGEFMRIDCQKQLEELGDLAVAALIETRRHQAPKIAAWAEKRLRLRNRLTPHDAVRTDEPRALADILVALGSLRDPESTRLLISFAGTEQSQIRNAARQGIALMGNVAAWQLRDAYLNTTGKRPPRDWTWKRTARELFTEFDRLRLEESYKLFAIAKKAGESGNLKKMRDGFDKILLQHPTFERRAEMANDYLRYAESVRNSDHKAALIALERTERISDDEELIQRAQGLRKLLEATRLKEQGIIDQNLLLRAEQLSPNLASEASALRQTSVISSTWGGASRYLIATLTTILALGGAGWILLGGMRKRNDVSVGETKKTKQEQSPSTEALSSAPSKKPADPNVSS